MKMYRAVCFTLAGIGVIAVSLQPASTAATSIMSSCQLTSRSGY